MPEAVRTTSGASHDDFRRAQWTVLLATMFCYLFFYTGRQTFGFAIPGIEQELGISKTNLGWVSAALLWAYAAGQAVNGNMGDRFGGRVMMSLGAVLSCGLNWLLSFANGFAGLLFAWGANGLAQSMAWAPGSRVLSNWWSPIHRGRVYGAYVFAAGMSSVLAFTTSSLILSWDLNWRWIFRLPVLLLLAGGVTYYIFVRDRPEDRGFAPSSDDRESPDGASQPAHADATTIWQRYAVVLRNGRFLMASLAIGFQNCARYGLLIWVPVHMLGVDWKEDVYGKWISLALPVGMAAGALASGWASDRLFDGRRSKVIVLSMTMAALTTAAMYRLSDHPWAGIPLLFLAGLFAYGPQAAFWALCPDLMGHHHAGTATGVMNSFAYIFAGLGEPLIGWIIESNDGKTSLAFLVVATSCAASATLAMFVRR